MPETFVELPDVEEGEEAMEQQDAPCLYIEGRGKSIGVWAGMKK